MKILSTIVHHYIIPLLILALSGCNSRKHELTGKENQSIPSFNLLMPDSVTYYNTSNIQAGKPVVLYYFNPQCPFCKAQMEDIKKNMDKLKDIQFLIFTSFSFDGMKSFYNKFDLSKYSNVITGVDTSYFFANYFQTTNVPYLAVYGKDLKLNEAFLGKTRVKDIKKLAFEQ
jgi:thiol-disulfide isomerase/thioredoxin